MTEDSADFRGLFDAARAAQQAGDYQRAETLYGELLSRNPRHVGALLNLASMVRRFGHRHVALNLVRAALEVAPGSALGHLQLGLLHMDLHEPREAVNAFREALRINPALPDVEPRLRDAENALRLEADPDYGSALARTWSENDSVWQECEGRDTLFVLFAGLGLGRLPPTFIFHNFLQRYDDIDKIYVRDLTMSWYQRGLKGLTTDVESTAKLLGQKISGYRKAVFIGTSAGGFGAILFGELLGVDKVIAFAPQSVVSEAMETEIGDFRWASRLEQLRTTFSNPRYADLENLAPFRTAIDIHYSSRDPLDRLHARRVTGSQVRRIEHPGGHHVIALQLRDNGELDDIIAAEILGR